MFLQKLELLSNVDDQQDILNRRYGNLSNPLDDIAMVSSTPEGVHLQKSSSNAVLTVQIRWLQLTTTVDTEIYQSREPVSTTSPTHVRQCTHLPYMYLLFRFYDRRLFLKLDIRSFVKVT